MVGCAGSPRAILEHPKTSQEERSCRDDKDGDAGKLLIQIQNCATRSDRAWVRHREAKGLRARVSLGPRPRLWIQWPPRKADVDVGRSDVPMAGQTCRRGRRRWGEGRARVHVHGPPSAARGVSVSGRDVVVVVRCYVAGWVSGHLMDGVSDDYNRSWGSDCLGKGLCRGTG